MENRTLEITALSGTKYMFVEFTIFSKVVNTYAWYNNRWNRLTTTFHSLEEAQEWVNKLNRDYQEQKSKPKTAYTMPTSAYYSITGYYGD